MGKKIEVYGAHSIYQISNRTKVKNAIYVVGEVLFDALTFTIMACGLAFITLSILA